MPRGAARETEAPDQQVNLSTPVAAQPGLEFPRFFSREGSDPFDEIEWGIAGGADRQRAG